VGLRACPAGLGSRSVIGGAACKPSGARQSLSCRGDALRVLRLRSCSSSAAAHFEQSWKCRAASPRCTQRPPGSTSLLLQYSRATPMVRCHAALHVCIAAGPENWCLHGSMAGLWFTPWPAWLRHVDAHFVRCLAFCAPC